ncbi:hypothetical protein IMSHALPRED_007245 [Imshaugia aleurites]|uniref:Uncharacterized protein n=1 Tax=Imshaugia aleurites TaxID=172621 RepID=A0A8H3FMZ7_9LECA|nr:hypothetical protein IMSHALPRED_007245 [Imshaugia aleurites]
MASLEEKKLANCVTVPHSTTTKALSKSTKPKTTKETKETKEPKTPKKPTTATKGSESTAPKAKRTKKATKEPDRKILIAVDFDTTFSGIAWAQTRDPGARIQITQ